LGITGSNGKTTTTTLVGEMLKASGRTVWVGGNIGQPLIEVVDQIGPDDIVVMELSSFQLEYFHVKLNQNISNIEPEALATLLGNWSPQISAILNITPNHLDRHPSMKHYVRAKRALINYQDRQGRLIMSLDNDMTRTIGGQFGARTRWFSLEAQMPNGAALVGNALVLFDENEQPQQIASRSEIKLRGMHNLSNILAACLISREAGVSLETMQQVVTTFAGVDHRLQFVRELGGVQYYNDSIATSPERLGAALRSFDEPLVLLVGGRDKHLPWEDVARLMMHKTRHIILFGEAAALIAKAVKRAYRETNLSHVSMQQCVTLEEAVNLGHQIAQPGEVVLLSPGCTSFDAFRDFAERGRLFALNWAVYATAQSSAACPL
jgi:UDP-N-acetylmuramoylalanine--D-glutamate ligase